MEKKNTSSETKISLGSHEILYILRNPKLITLSTNPTTYPFLNQINLANESPFPYLTNHFNIVLPFMPRFFKLSLSFTLYYKNVYEASRNITIQETYIEMLSCNHCCYGKTMSITQPECVYL